jgi:hypothetical protein
MIRSTDVYRRIDDDWVSRFILDEVIIMPLCKSEEDVQHIFSISNAPGSRIWQLLDGSYSVKEIQEIMQSEYEGTAKKIEKDVVTFLEDVLEAKLIAQTKKKTAKKPSRNRKKEPKKPYTSPEIAKVKMQPEQAVLACCTVSYDYKTAGSSFCTLFSFCFYPGGDCGRSATSPESSSSAGS